METKIERCGFCGRYFRGTEYLEEQEAYAKADFEHQITPLGYCPEAEMEQDVHEGTGERRTITRDMAIDAGDLSLEGQPF
jgi:hypothetical protein